MARIKHPVSRSRGPKKSTQIQNSTTSPSSAIRSKTRARQTDTPSTSRAHTQSKLHRFRPGRVALQEIRRFQKTWKLLIPAAPFIRLVKNITAEYSQAVNRWTAEAIVALQEFNPIVIVIIPVKKDFELARRLGGKGRPW